MVRKVELRIPKLLGFAMRNQAEGSISRGYKGNICTKCLGSYTGTAGQHAQNYF